MVDLVLKNATLWRQGKSGSTLHSLLARTDISLSFILASYMYAVYTASESKDHRKQATVQSCI